MRYSLQISEQAEGDLRGLFEYIAFKLLSPENAIRQLDRLETAINSLAEYPERHAMYDAEPWRGRGLRMLPVDNYIVFYITDKQPATVSVVRVLYGGRDIEKALREDIRRNKA